MGVFVVERYLAGWDPREVDALVELVAQHADEFRARGVHYLRSIVLAADETCLCLFEGSDAETIRCANQDASLPVHRVVPATMTVEVEELAP